MDELLPDALARLSATVETLERRVYALENPASNQPSTSETAEIHSIAAPIAQPLPSPQTGGVFSVVGKAMLGIAGAYLLRAMAESTTFPRAAIVAIAIAYAAMWLAAATRVKTEARFASIAYAATSVLILVPMLWELTLRFSVFPAAMAASVLAAFVVASFVLAWKRHFAAVVWVTTAVGSTSALIMAVATHDLLPFIVAILVMAMASEYAAAHNRSSAIRLWAAASADIAVCALIYIASRPADSRLDYKQVSEWLLLTLSSILLLLYGASATAQTVLCRRKITFFEVAQTLVAFLLAAWSMLAFRSGAGAIALGMLCLMSSALGYALVFARFDATTEQRNYHVYATGSAALFLVGVYLCLPSIWLVLVLAAAAIVTTIFGVRTEHLTLEFHGLVFLWAAALSSGLLLYIAHAFAGTVPASPTGLILIVAAAAVVSYAVERRFQADQWRHYVLDVLSAILALGATAAFLVYTLVRLTEVAITPGASQIAVIRTLTTCALALVLAYSGSRWRRKELAWLAYGALVFVASKLVFEDMRHGHLGFTAASIFLYAITLLLVPRLVRLGQKTKDLTG
ncbi:MAG TPA: hypothetical protein VMV98_07255 [Acidobacteriaceae bacterium]|nr:hypothetical protein [Acidobacteriaceae bacterium]